MRPRQGRGRRRPLVALISTLLFAGAAFGAVHWWQDGRHGRAAELRARDVAATLRTGLSTPIESLHAVRALMETPKPGLSLAQFRAFCRPMLERQPAIVALEWFPVVSGPQRVAFERWVSGEQAGFTIREPMRSGAMVPALARAEHVPLTLSEPLVPQVQGLDIAFDAPRVNPVWRALELGHPTLSDRYQLVEDPEGVYSVVAYAPVRHAAWVTDPQAAGGAYSQGVVVALFRLRNLVESALQARERDGLGLRLEDLSAPEELRLLYDNGIQHALQTAVEVPFVDKQYRLTVSSPAGGPFVLPWVAAALVLLLGGSWTAYLDIRRRARQLERTVERLGVYQLEGVIASGGMGTVYKARHALLKRPTAIKIARDGQTSVHFEKEVLLTSALSHPNTVQVYDFGKGEDGAFYYAMEYIEGYNLQELVQRAGPLPPARAVRILLQIAGSLEEAHQRGLVHRDVKPSNVMLTQRGGVSDFVKVLDFGLAKAHSAEHAPGASMLSAAFAGTPGYVAPEVVAGAPASPLSDMFSFGCVAYYLLTGNVPFTGSTTSEALTRVLTFDPPPLPATVPASLARLVMDCLSKQPEERPSSMRQLGESLKRVAVDCGKWSPVDAESWWATNPPPSYSESAQSGPLTFILKQRSTGASNSPGKSIES